MGCLRLFRCLRRRSQQDDALLASQQRLGPRPYRDHESKHQHSPSADSSFSTDFAEKVSISEGNSRYRGSSRTGSVAVPVIRPNVNPSYSAYATPEVYRYGGAGPRDGDDAYARAKAAAATRGVNQAEKKGEVDVDVDVDSPEQRERRRKAEEEEQERMDFLQMM